MLTFRPCEIQQLNAANETPDRISSLQLKESSMSLDADDVKKIAYLARLKIDEADIPGYVSNLSSILDLVEQMSSVDTEGVLPMSHPMDAVQRLREDKVTESDQRDNFQQIAPQTEDGLYLVPKVIE
jgi:aspartyl-tRNA(Asn)/glutamyl-tRNA(Gln) amidotransferase subunit C